MAISPNFQDREFDKFLEDTEGNTAVRVVPIEEPTTDIQLFELLKSQNEIVKQLKIMNLHLSIISNHDIDKKEV